MGELADEQEVFAASEEDVRKAEKIIETVSRLQAHSLVVCFKQKCKILLTIWILTGK